MKAENSSEITPNEHLVDRKIVEKYCEIKNIQNISLLLQSFVENGIADFVDFLQSKSIGNAELQKRKNYAVLLHGSPNNINSFEPRISVGGGNKNKHEALVYATDDSEYSIFMAILHQRKGTAGISYSKGKFSCYVDLEFVNSSSSLENGFVYVLDKSNFSSDIEHEFYSPHEEIPIFAIPVEPKDLQTTIEIKSK